MRAAASLAAAAAALLRLRAAPAAARADTERLLRAAAVEAEATSRAKCAARLLSCVFLVYLLTYLAAFKEEAGCSGRCMQAKVPRPVPARSAAVTEELLRAAVQEVEAEAARVRGALRRAGGRLGVDGRALARVWSKAFTFTARHTLSVPPFCLLVPVLLLKARLCPACRMSPFFADLSPWQGLGTHLFSLTARLSSVSALVPPFAIRCWLRGRSQRN
ncbi:unnamed protein product, partial [Prorocentrum cordatum]